MEQTRSVEMARRIRAARALCGKKTGDLARDVDSLLKSAGYEPGMSQSTLYRLERGERLPNALELEAIAQATSQELSFFYEASSDSSGRGRGPTAPPTPRQRTPAPA